MALGGIVWLCHGWITPPRCAMKRFSCPVCANELHFDNSDCLACGTAVGYQSVDAVFLPLPDAGRTNVYQPCVNRDAAGCNWLVRPGTGQFCTACRHNRTVPDLAVDGNAEAWRELEQAKRYLFYSILRWRLPHPSRDDAPNGLAFDFLADTVTADGRVDRAMTGHAQGLITLAIAEGDDAERERRRTALGEPYRTLIGHFRHEVGHFYWDLLVRDGGWLDRCRAVFGDDRLDYAEALARNYAEGPPPDWETRYISSYAAVHPWEDFAETWAHYVHIVDASETAHAFGMTLRPHRSGGEDIELETNPYFGGTIDDILADWVPLTVAMNCLNRSLGQPDMYPFVLNEPVREKLSFIHDLVRAS